MDTDILEDLGLTRAEVKVYLALLRIGISTAGPIIERSGLQSSVVHMTLNNLVAKGFVSSVKEGRRNHYQAADPAHMLQFIEEKKLAFQELLPSLHLMQQEAKERSEVVVYQRVKGIRELLYELLEAGGTQHHTFGSTKESLMMGDAWWVQYHRKRAAKGIKASLLFNESLRVWNAQAKYPAATVRYTKAGFEPLTETIIRNDRIGIIIWTENPIGILIHNKAAAESYDKYFELLWTGAGK
jgi:sugar-specific transcriptional regulator TrmB